MTDRTALLLIDLINPFDYEGGRALCDEVEKIISVVQDLRQRCRKAELPVVYVNDNFGQWRSNFPETIAACESGAGGGIARALGPADSDYFVLKPQRSGFYCTPLALLLTNLEVGRVILAGVATDMCVLATANDACMRGLKVVVAGDATAAMDKTRRDRALATMEHGLQVQVANAADIPLRGVDNRVRAPAARSMLQPQVR